MSGQIFDELMGIDLGDKRLNRGSRHVMESLSVDPQASIDASFVNWADTLAAYRLFDRDAVTTGAILKPHHEATLARIGETLVDRVDQADLPIHFAKQQNTSIRREPFPIEIGDDLTSSNTCKMNGL